MRILIGFALAAVIGGYVYYRFSDIPPATRYRPLQVNVQSNYQAPIRQVAYEVFDDREAARYPFEHLTVRSQAYVPTGKADTVTKKNGVPIQTGTKPTLLDSESGYWQQRALLLVVEYRDGTRAGRLIDVPDMRSCDQITVAVDPGNPETHVKKPESTRSSQPPAKP